MMAWVDALRKYASMKGTKYHIPRKGTAEYEEVKAIQAGKMYAKSKRAIFKESDIAKADLSAGETVKPRKVIFSKKAIKEAEAVRSKIKGMREAEEKMKKKKMRKVRKDKGVKRGPKKAKAKVVEKAEEEMFYYQ